MSGGGADPFDGDDTPQMIVGINVTPLVDIALVLLLIFMVAATFIASSGIKVDLPKAASGSGHEQSKLSVTLTKDGAMYLNGQTSSDSAVTAYIAKMLPDNPELQAIIAADRSVAHGNVVHVIDLVKRAGVRRFAINVDPTTSLGAAGK